MGFVVLFLHDEHGFSTGEAAAVFAVGQGSLRRCGSASDAGRMCSARGCARCA